MDNYPNQEKRKSSFSYKLKLKQDSYRWDGYTPKWSFFNLFIYGTPDGYANHRIIKVYTY